MNKPTIFIRFLALLISIISYTQIRADLDLDLTGKLFGKGNEWKALYYNLEKKPHEKNKTWKNRFIRVGASSAITGAVATACLAILNWWKDRNILDTSVFYKNNRGAYSSVVCGTSIVGSAVLFGFIHEFLAKQSHDKNRHEQFMKLITYWPSNKESIPEELHGAFESLKETSEELNECAPEAIKLIMDRINAKLSPEERGVTLYHNFWHTIITCDIGSVIHGLSYLFLESWKIYNRQKEKEEGKKEQS